jgi:translation initiation factor 2 beta subunit (eIF-2beta)/eIF-5
LQTLLKLHAYLNVNRNMCYNFYSPNSAQRKYQHVYRCLISIVDRGSIDGNDCLIMKGRFQQKHIESILRKYIRKAMWCIDHFCFV